MTTPPSRLVLASASRQRELLLASVGIKPTHIQASDVNEGHHCGETPKHYCCRLAQAKAVKAAAHYPDFFILSADTAIVCRRQIWTKPTNRDQCVATLRMLSGRRHRVISAVALRIPDGRCLLKYVTTIVHFKRLNDHDIDQAMAIDGWQDKAAGYAAQGVSGGFIRKINGSWSNIIGLPLVETLALLRATGALQT